MLARVLPLLAAAVFAAACERRPPTPEPSPGPGGTITGRERLGWDQQAGNTSELNTFRYAIYVDGARTELTGVTCAPSPSTAGFACSAQLPPLSNGARSLQVATFVLDGTDVVESARSAALSVVVSSATAPVPQSGDWVGGSAGATADGVALRIERLAGGLDRPSDAAFTQDGRLFVAERAGRVRLVKDGVLQASPALTLEAGSPDDGLLAIAVDPEFASSRHVYTLSVTVSSRGTPVFRLTRYRELAGLLGQRAILLEIPAPPMPSAAMRFGGDGKLYLAFSSGGDGSPSAYTGKVLRLNPDASMPRDRRSPSPVVSAGFISPRALAWRPEAADLWIADGDASGREWFTRLTIADAPPSGRTWEIPPTETSSSLAFYQGELFPEFKGDLFIASAAARHILRLRFAAADRAQIAAQEVLLDEQVGPLKVVLPGPDGAIYFLTDGTLGRLTPVR